MNRIRNLWTLYHPLVWWSVAGTMLTRFTSFMVMPFMALYMKSHTPASASTIGLAIGCAALTSMLFGLIGGSLSDRFGRKQLMVIGLILNVLVMVGYANARTIFVFFLLSIGSGLTRVLFEPASQALMAEVTAPERRASVYAVRYWAINVGAAAGPIVGAYFGTVATGWTFYLAALANLLYLAVIIFVFPNKVTTSSGASTPSFSFVRTFRTVLYDKALLLFLVATFLSNIGYSQLETTLPQSMALTMNPARAAALFGIVLSSNAIEVVLLQLPISKLSRRMGVVASMMVGQGVFALGYVALGYGTGLWSYLIAMFVLTIGEIIIFHKIANTSVSCRTKICVLPILVHGRLHNWVFLWGRGLGEVRCRFSVGVLCFHGRYCCRDWCPIYHWSNAHRLHVLESIATEATM